METDLEKNADTCTNSASLLANGSIRSSTKPKFSWKNVSYSVGGKQILQNISGGVEKGTIFDRNTMLTQAHFLPSWDLLGLAKQLSSTSSPAD